MGVSVTINVREIRIIVTDANHTEVKLVAGNNYTLGTPSSATKITAHEIATGSVRRTIVVCKRHCRRG